MELSKSVLTVHTDYTLRLINLHEVDKVYLSKSGMTVLMDKTQKEYFHYNKFGRIKVPYSRKGLKKFKRMKCRERKR